MQHEQDNYPKGDSASVESLRLMLPESFTPSINEVLIGRGKKIMNHSGNIRFRDLIRVHLHQYSTATSKTTKTAILVHIVEQVAAQSPLTGGFVKYSKEHQRWFAVDETAKRMTTAQAFRDFLHFNYRSSKQNKQNRRLQARMGCVSKADAYAQDFQDLSLAGTQAPNPYAFLQSGSACGSSKIFSKETSASSGEMALTKLWLDSNPSSSSTSKVPGIPAASSNCGSRTRSLKESLEKSLRLLDTFDEALEDPPFTVDSFTSRPLHPSTVSLDSQATNSFSKLLSSLSQDVDLTSDPFEPQPILPLRQPHQGDERMALQRTFDLSSKMFFDENDILFGSQAPEDNSFFEV